MDSHDASSRPDARRADARLAAPQPDYRPAWQDYRRREWWFFGESFGGFCAIVAVCELARRLGLPSVAELAIPVLAPLWMIGFVVLGWRVSLFPCPRCHRPFFFRFFCWCLFVRSCRHCGLPLWAATNVRTPGSLFAWYPPDDEPAAKATEPVGDGGRQSPCDAVPRWRRHAAGLMQISAALMAVVTIIELAAALRWLIIERRSGANLNPLLPGVAITLGQALLAGAIVEAVSAVLLWRAADWIQRPGPSPPSQGRF
jgi:hypothetical protein